MIADSGIINPCRQSRIDALKAAVDAAKGTAQTLVNALPRLESKQKMRFRTPQFAVNDAAFTALTQPGGER